MNYPDGVTDSHPEFNKEPGIQPTLYQMMSWWSEQTPDVGRDIALNWFASLPYIYFLDAVDSIVLGAKPLQVTTNKLASIVQSDLTETVASYLEDKEAQS